MRAPKLKHTRIRRGRVVEIPAGWIGQVPSHRTIMHRPSKGLHKLRKFVKHGTRKSLADRREEVTAEEHKKEENP